VTKVRIRVREPKNTGLYVVDVPFTELNNALPGADPILDAAKTARNFYCDIYRQYPRGVIPSLDTPAGQMADGFNRRLCEPSDVPLPPPAAPPIPGGKCPVQYTLLTNTQQISGGNLVPQNNHPTGTFTGPIQGYSINRQNGTENPGGGFYGDSINIFIVDGFGITRTFFIATYTNTPGGGGPFSSSLTRVDGNPDNCGSLPPEYPNTPLPPSALVGNREIPVGGNNVTVPIAVVPVLFAPVNVFKPEVNINLGPFNFNFNAGGLNINPSFSPTTNIYLPGVPPGPGVPPALPPAGGGNNEAIDLSELNAKLNELLICDRCEPDFSIAQTNYPAATGRVISIPPNTLRVDLDIASLGVGVDVQFGDGGPNVLLVGWCAFGTAGGWSIRHPVSYDQNTFYPPEGANQFSYTVKKGSTATLNVVYQVES